MHEPQVTADDREAYFGGFRVHIDGFDARGFFSRDAAEQYAAKCAERHPGRRYTIHDTTNRPQPTQGA